jgi:hypothetical protein
MDATIAVSSHEAVLFVSRLDMGWSGSPASFAGAAIAEVMGSWGPHFADRRSSMDVFIVSAGSIRTETVQGWGHVQGLLDDEIIATAGGKLCRWRGDKFQELSGAEIDAMWPRLTKSSAVWRIETLPSSASQIERAFRVDGRAYRVRGWIGADNIARVTILDDSGAVQVEWSADRNLRAVDALQYEALFRR